MLSVILHWLPFSYFHIPYICFPLFDFCCWFSTFCFSVFVFLSIFLFFFFFFLFSFLFLWFLLLFYVRENLCQFPLKCFVSLVLCCLFRGDCDGNGVGDDNVRIGSKSNFAFPVMSWTGFPSTLYFFLSNIVFILNFLHFLLSLSRIFWLAVNKSEMLKVMIMNGVRKFSIEFHADLRVNYVWRAPNEYNCDLWELKILGLVCWIF